MRSIRKIFRGCLIVLLALVVLSIVGLLLPDTDEPSTEIAQSTPQNIATRIPPTATTVPLTTDLPTATPVPPTATDLPPTSSGQSVTRFSTSLTRYTHGQVNLREGPGTSYNLAGSVPAGSSIEVVGESGDWYLIKHNAREVYIASWLAFDTPLSQSGGETTNVSAQTPATAVQAPAQVGSCRPGPNNVAGVRYEGSCSKLRSEGVCGFPKGDQNYSLSRDRDRDDCGCDCE